ncbi:MAG: toxic anion resistance protein [Thiolinea sp.]
MSTISEKMLEGVKNKDLGKAGALNDMITAIKGFDIDELNPNRKQSFWERLFGKAKPVVQFLNRYEDVRKQINTITDNMESHKTQLLTDVVTLDKLYEANLDFFHKLELYIAAGEENCAVLKSRTFRHWSPRRKPIMKTCWLRRPCVICAVPVMTWNAVYMTCA